MTDSNSLNYFKLAVVERKRRNYPKALRYINQALQIKPNSIKFLQEKMLCQAAIKRKQRNYITALEYIDVVLRDEPDNIKFLQEKAICYKELEDYEHAIPLMEKIVRLKPEDKQSRTELIECYRENYDFEKAISTAEVALSIEPTNNYFHFALLVIALFFSPEKQKCEEILQNYKISTRGKELFNNPSTEREFNSYINNLNEILSIQADFELLHKYISRLVKFKSYRIATELLVKLQSKKDFPEWVTRLLEKIPYSTVDRTVEKQLEHGQIEEENLPQLVKSNIPKIMGTQPFEAYIFTIDITGFSEQGSDYQLSYFDNLLKEFSLNKELNAVTPDDITVLLTGDGFILAFKGRDNEFMPVRLAESILRMNTLEKNIRVGLNCGLVYWIELSNGMRQVIGSSVNSAVRALDVKKSKTKKRNAVMLVDLYYKRLENSSYITSGEFTFKRQTDTTKNGEPIVVYEMSLTSSV